MHVAEITYEHFYGLRERPFQVGPDPRLLYWSATHAGAFDALRRALACRAPVALLTGDAGTGKTTLLNRLAATLPPDVAAARVPPALACGGEPVDWLLAALGQSAEGAPAARFARFRELVLGIRAAGRRVLLVFDEAQALGPDRLEELRLLAGFEESTSSPLQMLLVGRPGLRRNLSQPECTPLAQRIAVDFRLRPLLPEETAEYIAWRLHAAGAAGTAFEPGASRLVHDATFGVPRLINVLCDRVLGLGCAERSRSIGETLVERVLTEAGRCGGVGRFTPLTPRRSILRG